MLAIRQGSRKPKVILDQTKAREVYHQMLPDFPGPALSWVKDTHWIGPRRVPLSLFNTENRANWKASHEPEKVRFHQSMIQQGDSKPIIAGIFPDHPKLIIIDAHHRFLAYEALREEPCVWIGVIEPEHVEEALTTHEQQYAGPSKVGGPSILEPARGG